MIVDCHSHFWSAADELTADLRHDYQAVGYDVDKLELNSINHREGTQGADVVVVFGLRAKLSGFEVRNDTVARFVQSDPSRLIGFAALDPTEPDCLDELERCVSDLGMQGLKMAPIYSGFHPMDERALPIYARAEQLGLPILFHQGATFPRRAPLKYAHPSQLEDIALRHPDLKMIIAHFGHPWEEETFVLIRKQPNIFTDISGLYGRPWQHYNSLRLAQEYGVTHKILFATDYPFGDHEGTVQGIRNAASLAERAKLPPILPDLAERILQNPTLDLLGLKDPRQT